MARPKSSYTQTILVSSEHRALVFCTVCVLNARWPNGLQDGKRQ
jgi:hypothetical protein